MKWWHKLCTMEGDRYPRQFFDQIWEVKLWGKREDEVLLLNKEELLEKGNSSSKSF